MQSRQHGFCDKLTIFRVNNLITNRFLNMGRRARIGATVRVCEGSGASIQVCKDFDTRLMRCTRIHTWCVSRNKQDGNEII